jgi:hypothetical protein
VGDFHRRTQLSGDWSGFRTDLARRGFFFGDSYKYYFANLNFNKNPMALNFYNITSWVVAGLWSPSPLGDPCRRCARSKQQGG